MNTCWCQNRGNVANLNLVAAFAFGSVVEGFVWLVVYINLVERDGNLELLSDWLMSNHFLLGWAVSQSMCQLLSNSGLGDLNELLVCSHYWHKMKSEKLLALFKIMISFSIVSTEVSTPIPFSLFGTATFTSPCAVIIPCLNDCFQSLSLQLLLCHSHPVFFVIFPYWKAIMTASNTAALGDSKGKWWN